MKKLLAIFAFSSVAFADHVPPVGLDYKGTWVVLIAIGIVFTCLALAAFWALMDGQFRNIEKIKYDLTEPDKDWPHGTLLERPE